ncbi:MAG: 3-phosphoshikimate 1-carboxyvinyltransferase [Nitrospirae bacterium]|nr:3-phosphoshikimate 1-carboxyvinyltransferase [Nitrospirota bacterium]
MNVIKITNKGALSGEIAAPPDKSISHRAVILAAIADGKSSIKNFLAAEDPLRTVEAFRRMEIEIEVAKWQSDKVAKRQGTADLIIHGRGLMGLTAPNGVIGCGNSGTTMRLLCGVLAGQPFSVTLTGDASLSKRPMQRIITPLTEMGAKITSQAKGCPPLNVAGGSVKPISYKSPVASAQVKSAVLLAGLYGNGITSVLEPDRSRDHTERMLGAAGVEIKIKNLEVSVKGRAHLKPIDITVPGDFSSAAFFIAAGAVVPGSEILIRNVGVNPTRTGLLEILKLMGARIEIKNEHEVSGEPVADLQVRYAPLTGIAIGGGLILRAIDEFPILCAAASLASGTTTITGARELRVKESDRIKSMAEGLKKIGAGVEELEDGIIIHGKERLLPATLQSYGDHRVAMAMAIAGLMTQGETIVEDSDCINTSFPGFMEMLNRLQMV